MNTFITGFLVVALTGTAITQMDIDNILTEAKETAQKVDERTVMQAADIYYLHTSDSSIFSMSPVKRREFLILNNYLR